MQINIRIDKLPELKNALMQWPEIAGRHLQTAIHQTALMIQEGGKSRVPVDTHLLKQSITTRESALRAIIGPTVKYGLYVEEGTKPHWPPIQPIEDWARRHGLKGKGFVIARAISRRGTKAQPFMKPAVEEAKLRIELAFKMGLERIVNEIASKVK